MADVKEGTFLGSAALPQADGTQKAVEVHIFPEQMRGTGEGHRGARPVPGGTMTNGTSGANRRPASTAAPHDGQVQGRREEDRGAAQVVGLHVQVEGGKEWSCRSPTPQLHEGALVSISAFGLFCLFQAEHVAALPVEELGQDGQSPGRVPPRQGVRGVRHDHGAEQPEGRDAERRASLRGAGARRPAPICPRSSPPGDVQPNEVYNLGAISFVALRSSRPS